MRKINKILACAALTFMVLANSQAVKAANFGSINAYGIDTIAGYSSLITSSKGYPNRAIYFSVTKPEGSVVSFPAVTAQSGVAKADLYDFHTRKAGQYTVSARYADSMQNGEETSFQVFPDQISVEQSVIASSSSIAKADGADVAYLTVQLKDQYDNPFQGHLVKLISSRHEDIAVSAVNPAVTDQNGSITFKVTSDSPGVSIFSAIDLTSGVVLSARTQVAYLSNGNSLADSGGYLGSVIPYASAADAGPLNHFFISEIPDSLKVNQNVSFKLTAQDADNLTVQNYTGTVHFSTEGSGGDNVSLPEDYTFKAEDLGAHSFSLALNFKKSGTYKIVATDINNMVIKGTATVNVGTAGNGLVVGTLPTTSKNITITTPVAGSYSENIQTVLGSADNGATIKIYDNNQEIGSVQASSSGKFTYQTSQLADGKHVIYAVMLDSSNAIKGTSDNTEINIDTTPPKVDEISVDPSSGIKPGTVITITVYSEENLIDSALIFNKEIIAMSADPLQPGMYTGKISAPLDSGEYPVDVVLVDSLNNEADYKAKALINVSNEGGQVQTQESVTTQESQQVTQETQTGIDNTPPTRVYGLISYGSDKRVTLVWEASTDDKKINHYRIYYGLDQANLDKVVDTKNAATTWYVPNLENGKEVYFGVVAVDDEGLESTDRSEIVSAIPFTLETTTAVTNRPEGALTDNNALHGASIEGNTPPEMSKNGPEVIWLMYGTGILSGAVHLLRRKKK